LLFLVDRSKTFVAEEIKSSDLSEWFRLSQFMMVLLKSRSKSKISQLESQNAQALELLQRGDNKAFIKYVDKHSELVRYYGKGKSTLLHVACADHKLELAEYLIAKGANIDAQDDYGRTPLMDAVYYANIPLVKLLLQHNADISCQSNKRSTVIYYATRGQEGNLEILNLLLAAVKPREKESVLNYLIQDVSPCKTALDFAQNPKIREVLEQNGAVMGVQVEVKQRYEYHLSKVGETLKFKGYEPKYPAVLLPGTCSSALEVRRFLFLCQ
jgi:hypothetical protein